MISSKISKSFHATNHSVGSRLCQPKELPRNFRVDKIFRYFVSSSCAQEKTKKTAKMDIRKMQIVLYVLDKVSDVFPNTRDFIKKELEEKCSKEGISEKELFCFALLFFFFCFTLSLMKACVFGVRELQSHNPRKKELA